MQGIFKYQGFHVKASFYALTLCIIFCTPRSFAVRPANEDSLKAVTALVSPFIYQQDSTVIVDQALLKAGLLYDVESQKIVWQKDMNKTYPIASLTKMMVALITVEDIHAGKVRWDDQVAWTRDVYYWV